jgi:hypothetical protein
VSVGGFGPALGLMPSLHSARARDFQAGQADRHHHRHQASACGHLRPRPSTRQPPRRSPEGWYRSGHPSRRYRHGTSQQCAGQPQCSDRCASKADRSWSQSTAALANPPRTSGKPTAPRRQQGGAEKFRGAPDLVQNSSSLRSSGSEGRDQPLSRRVAARTLYVPNFVCQLHSKKGIPLRLC